MKAILIDPTQRELRGIEVQSHELSAAFGAKKILLLTKMIGWHNVLYHDGLGSISACFWFEGVRSRINGKALLLGRDKGKWPVSTTMTVKDVECLVKFV